MAQYRIVDKTTFNEIGKWTKEKIEAKATEINEAVDNKVDKVEGSSLATTAQLEQIETNKNDITSLQEGLAKKIDSEEGKSLIPDTDLTQIQTNKTDITEIKSQLEGVEASLSGLNTRMESVV